MSTIVGDFLFKAAKFFSTRKEKIEAKQPDPNIQIPTFLVFEEPNKITDLELNDDKVKKFNGDIPDTNIIEGSKGNPEKRISSFELFKKTSEKLLQGILGEDADVSRHLDWVFSYFEEWRRFDDYTTPTEYILIKNGYSKGYPSSGAHWNTNEDAINHMVLEFCKCNKFLLENQYRLNDKDFPTPKKSYQNSIKEPYKNVEKCREDFPTEEQLKSMLIKAIDENIEKYMLSFAKKQEDKQKQKWADSFSNKNVTQLSPNELMEHTTTEVLKNILGDNDSIPKYVKTVFDDYNYISDARDLTTRLKEYILIKNGYSAYASDSWSAKHGNEKDHGETWNDMTYRLAAKLHKAVTKGKGSVKSFPDEDGLRVKLSDAFDIKIEEYRLNFVEKYKESHKVNDLH